MKDIKTINDTDKDTMRSGFIIGILCIVGGVLLKEVIFFYLAGVSFVCIMLLYVLNQALKFIDNIKLPEVENRMKIVELEELEALRLVGLDCLNNHGKKRMLLLIEEEFRCKVKEIEGTKR